MYDASEGEETRERHACPDLILDTSPHFRPSSSARISIAVESDTLIHLSFFFFHCIKNCVYLQ